MKATKRFFSVVTLVLMFVFASGICVAEEGKAHAKEKKTAACEGVVNINKAASEELQLLPGIGEKTAQAITDYIKEHGEFAAVEDIKNVKGIGDKTFENIKDFLAVKGETTLKKIEPKK